MKKSLVLSVILAICSQIDAMNQNTNAKNNHQSSATRLEVGVQTDDPLPAAFTGVMNGMKQRFKEIKNVASEAGSHQMIIDLANKGNDESKKYADPDKYFRKDLEELVKNNPDKGPYFLRVANQLNSAQIYLGNGKYSNQTISDMLQHVEDKGTELFLYETDVREQYYGALDGMVQQMSALKAMVGEFGAGFTRDQMDIITKMQEDLEGLTSSPNKSQASNLKSNTTNKMQNNNSNATGPNSTTGPTDSAETRIRNYIQAAHQNPDSIYENIINIRKELENNVEVRADLLKDYINLMNDLIERPDLVEHLNNLTGTHHFNNPRAGISITFLNDQFSTILVHLAHAIRDRDYNTLRVAMENAKTCCRWADPARTRNPMNGLRYAEQQLGTDLDNTIRLDEEDRILALSIMLFSIINESVGRYGFVPKNCSQEDANSAMMALQNITYDLINLMIRR